MARLNLCLMLLLLCLTRCSLQGGVKPQVSGHGGGYFSPLTRGAGALQPGAGMGLAGAKAGKYSAFGTQGLTVGVGYRMPAGYGTGIRGVGYPHQGPPLGGLGARGKPSKAGYMGGVGAGSFPSNGMQNGYGNGYGAGGNGFPLAGAQPGAQIPYGSQLGGPAAAAAASTKYGGAGQLPFRGQPQQPVAAGLGDYGAGRYGGPSQLPYGAQPAGLGVEGKAGPFGGPQVGYESQPSQAIGLDGNGNGLGYLNSRDLQANGLGAAAYGPLAAGQAPGAYGSLLGPGQPLGGYRGKESKYGMNGYMGNGYRSRCSSGKC
ncbi:glycine-rich extracellular protein 1 isoform X2 [Pantherophis guttatus]|uniref:Glycine-rich extracellular protein 1 isoform X2 n=1 Tax=Pantherophis guttatus TaxID=94885 RepID=A0A6P9C9H9_PANGU|nr:glycine-rich extracellular protein 1 isoform X2 [Pantherophis guttatus]